MYRMNEEDFAKLIQLLGPSLDVDDRVGSLRSVTGVTAGSLVPELRLHCLIRWLSGGSYIDSCSQVEIHQSTFYAIIWETVEKIRLCPDLALKFPTSISEAREIADGFQSISTEGVVGGCIGAIDGWLYPIIAPPRRVGDVNSYYSGHLSRFGLNVQAICDHHCRFTYMSVAAPGVSRA